MRRAGRRNRPESAGAQRGIAGELPVTHERCHLAHPAVLVDHLGPVGHRRLIDAVDGDPGVGGIAVVPLGISAHVHIGQCQHGVAATLGHLRQALGQVPPQVGRVQGHDGAHQGIAVGQATGITGGNRLVHQGIYQAAVDVDSLGRVGAEWTVGLLGAVGSVVVERFLECFGLIDVGLDRVGIGVDSAIEDHRPHLVRVRLGVRGADPGAVGVAEVVQLVVSDSGPQLLEILGDTCRSDVGQEFGAHLVDAALDELLRGALDVVHAFGAVVHLWVGAQPVGVGV